MIISYCVHSFDFRETLSLIRGSSNQGIVYSLFTSLFKHPRVYVTRFMVRKPARQEKKRANTPHVQQCEQIEDP